VSKDQASRSEGGVRAVLALAELGDGVLSRHHTGVWSYPGAPLDPHATNLVMPIAHVSEAEVREALAAGDVVVVSMNSMNEPLAVRVLSADQKPPRILTGAMAGSPEAGTEVPENYRPTHDAGSVPVSPAAAARLAERSLAAALTPPQPTKPTKAPPGQKPTKSKDKSVTAKAPAAGAAPAASGARPVDAGAGQPEGDAGAGAQAPAQTPGI